VSAVPGPSALTAALSVSGLPTDAVSFYGFLPRKAGKKKRLLENLQEREETLVFLESTHRILETLALIGEVFKNREITVCRELTKKFEEIRTGLASESVHWFQGENRRGEFVIIVRGRSRKEKTSGQNCLGEGGKTWS